MNTEKITKKKAIVAALIIIVSIFIAVNVTAEESIEGGIFEGDVTVTLDATDDWSGVNHTMYRICFTDLGGNEGMTEWMEYSEPFIVSEMGLYNISYYSVDIAGNVEETKYTEFSIIGDITPPETICILDGIIH